MGRQGTTACPPLGRVVLAQAGIALLRLRLALGDRLLKSFQAELQLLFRRSLTATSRSALRASWLAIAVSIKARNAAISSGRLCGVLCAASVTGGILHRNGRSENPFCGLNARPIEAIK